MLRSVPAPSPSAPWPLRRLVPTDRAGLVALFHRLTPQDVRWRFGTALKELPEPLLDALSQPDRQRHWAWVVEDPSTGVLVGAMRAIRSTVDPSQAELAVEVDPAFTGHGLAARLWDALSADLRRAGVTEIQAHVASDNERMRAWCRQRGWRAVGPSEAGDGLDVRGAVPAAPSWAQRVLDGRHRRA